MLAFHRPYPTSTVGMAFGIDPMRLAAASVDKDNQAMKSIFEGSIVAKQAARELYEEEEILRWTGD